MLVKWIFFDVGTTLVDEEKAYDHRVFDMIKDTNITFEEFNNKRIELARQGLDGNSAAIKYFNLNKTPWHSEDEVLYEDTIDVLEYLKSKGYKLGIITWSSKFSSEKFLEEVAVAKKEWISSNFPNIKFDEFVVLDYSCNKASHESTVF